MGAPTTDPVIARFREARRDPSLVVLGGFHAIKHALRFGAEVLEVVAADVTELTELSARLAPDVTGRLMDAVTVIPSEVLAELAHTSARPVVMALARRPAVDVAGAFADPRDAPIVLLEDPRSMNNMGACVRVAAAADAAAVFTTGTNDPWQPESVAGAAGLHFALPVARITELPASDRPLLAIDPDGDDLQPDRLPARAILAFGTERYGLSDDLLARADARIRIPMREDVSSLNLATSVSAVLFAWRLSPSAPPVRAPRST